MPKTKEETKKPTASGQLQSLLEANKDEHFNFQDAVDFEVSTGSLILDLEVGLLTPGIIRHTGVSRGGKTSQMIQNVKNFLDNVEGGRGLWVVAEGRWPNKINKESGVKFVNSTEEWEDGTCFIWEGQIFESVFDTIRALIGKNPEKKKYFFVIDSTNGLKRRADMQKSTGEAEKVAGAALFTSDFLSRVSLGMSKLGHVLGLIGQVRSNIKTNQYEKGDPKLSNATGGAAQDHYPSIFLEFQPRYKADLIGDPNNPTGHWAKARVIKSSKEKTTQVKYPIKYGKGVWLEYELADLMLQWGMVKKKGTWLSFSDTLIQELRESMEIEDDFQVQGMDQLRTWLEENPAAVNVLYDKFKTVLHES